MATYNLFTHHLQLPPETLIDIAIANGSPTRRFIDLPPEKAKHFYTSQINLQNAPDSKRGKVLMDLLIWTERNLGTELVYALIKKYCVDDKGKHATMLMLVSAQAKKESGIIS
jgi:hypothetical protein